MRLIFVTSCTHAIATGMLAALAGNKRMLPLDSRLVVMIYRTLELEEFGFLLHVAWKSVSSSVGRSLAHHLALRTDDGRMVWHVIRRVRHSVAYYPHFFPNQNFCDP